MRVIDLTPATRGLLTPACAHCVWWQTADPPAARTPRHRGSARASDPPLPSPLEIKQEWERVVSLRGGLFGKALTEDESVLGWVHAAPAQLLARAHTLPAGPPTADAWLLTCAYLYDEEYLGGFQRLLVELMGDLKARNVDALEAFALCPTRLEDRFRGYLRERNLFNHETLEGAGFRPVKLAGDVVRYRLDLAALVAVPRHARLLEAWDTIAAQPI